MPEELTDVIAATNLMNIIARMKAGEGVRSPVDPRSRDEIESSAARLGGGFVYTHSVAVDAVRIDNYAHCGDLREALITEIDGQQFVLQAVAETMN